MPNVLVLGIETSCDETAAAVVEDGTRVRSNIIYSQFKLHKKFFGVVPEIASRRHVEIISQVIEEALQEAGVDVSNIDRIAVTNRPGLIGALLVGVSTAKAIAYAAEKPLVPVNHIEAHAFSACLTHPHVAPPYVSLVVSGGHTSLYGVKDFKNFELLGRTIDDAAGEAFDKVSKILGGGYPGGPWIDERAKSFTKPGINFPRTYLNKNTFDFSFSGLKTAVLYKVRPVSAKRDAQEYPDPDEQVSALAKGFQEAVVDVLVHKSVAACRMQGSRRLTLGGGVACNSRLRECMKEQCSQNDIDVFFPEAVYCTDNAAMIAGIGFYQEPLKINDAMILEAVPTL